MQITSEEAAYVAGLFDGEGCVSIHDNGEGYVVMHVSLGQRDGANAVVKWLHQTIGAGSLSEGRPTGPNKCLMTYWQVSGHSAKPFLEVVRPYLRVKHAQVDVALELLAIPKGSKNPEHKQLRRDLLEKMRTVRS